MIQRAFLVSIALGACSVYDTSLLTADRDARTGGRGSAAGVGQEGGEAGDASSRGGAGTGGGVATGGNNGGDDGGSDGGGAFDTGGMGPASGGATSGGVSAGGAASGGVASGGVANGGVTSGGKSATGGVASGGAAGGGKSASGGVASGGVASGGVAGGGKGGALGTGGTTGGQASGGAAGAGGAAVLFSDNFEVGNASAWATNSSGDWSVVSDGSLTYRQGTVVNAFRVSAAGSAAWQDQSVQARVKVLAFGGTAVSSSYFAALCARYTDENNHYYLALRSDGKISIRRKVMGSNASIGSAITPGQPITTATWYTVKLEAIGTTLNAYVDGALIDSVTDTSFASGKIALGSTNASVVFDDVVVKLP